MVRAPATTAVHERGLLQAVGAFLLGDAAVRAPALITIERGRPTVRRASFRSLPGPLELLRTVAGCCDDGDQVSLRHPVGFHIGITTPQESP